MQRWPLVRAPSLVHLGAVTTRSNASGAIRSSGVWRPVGWRRSTSRCRASFRVPHAGRRQADPPAPGVERAVHPHVPRRGAARRRCSITRTSSASSRSGTTARTTSWPWSWCRASRCRRVLRKAAREHRPPSPALTAYLVAQAASGLAYAHTLTDGDGRPLGVVHRDVSPQNVLISFEGAVKMIDFGVARAFGRVAHTSPGGLKGKIDYMSPEQASAEEVDHRADVFALGVVLWEALTGQAAVPARDGARDDARHRRRSDPASVGGGRGAGGARRDRHARAAQAARRALRQRARDGGRARAVRVHARRVQPDAGRRATRSRCSPPNTCSGARRRPRRWTWRSRSRAAARRRASSAEPPTAGPTMALATGRRLVGRPQRGAQRGRPQPQPQRPEPGLRRAARARTAGRPPPTVNRFRPRRNVAPKRDRTWLYAVVGVLLAIGGAGAWMLTRQQEINSLIGQPAATPAAAAVVPSIDKLATPAEAAKPEPTAVAPAGAPAPRGVRRDARRRDSAAAPDRRQQTDTGGRIHVPEGALARGEIQTAKRAPPPPGGRSPRRDRGRKARDACRSNRRTPTRSPNSGRTKKEAR